MSPAWQVSAGPHPTSGTECQALHALTDCVAPLVRDLRERGLVGGYFFVNRWPEQHIRLRLKPIGAGDVDEVSRTAEAAVARYLARRAPGLPGRTVDHLVVEYADAERPPVGAGPGTGVRYERYEPQYGRYGGPAGLDLAEWHFERSSDLVLDLVHSVDTHTRSTMLGLTAQIAMIMSAVFLPDTDALVAHFDRAVLTDDEARYRAGYEQAGPALTTRFTELRRAVAADTEDTGLVGLTADWVRHCQELSGRVGELERAGALAFAPVPEVSVASWLLGSYLHGTANRLGASPADEAYLAYLLGRALRA